MGRPKKSTTVVTEDVKNEDVNNTTVDGDTSVKNTNVTEVVEPLVDTDEIDVISLVPNVSYLDSQTQDEYEWKESGHVEPMPFSVIKNMWRRNKGYFKNLWLKPLDERVIKTFRLEKIYEKYEFLMDNKNYTKKNMAQIKNAIANCPNSLKFSIHDKVSDLISTEALTDISLIRMLSKELNIDYLSLIET